MQFTSKNAIFADDGTVALHRCHVLIPRLGGGVAVHTVLWWHLAVIGQRKVEDTGGVGELSGIVVGARSHEEAFQQARPQVSTSRHAVLVLVRFMALPPLVNA